MIVLLLSLLAQDAEKGFILERDAKLFLADPLWRLREIHRKERVQYQSGNLVIEDLTFGEKLLIRTDKKTVWRIDTLAGTYSELTFDQVKARQKEILTEIQGTLERVKGSQDEAELKALLLAYGWFESEPATEVKSLGKSATVAGRECVGKDFVVNGDTYLFSQVYVDPTLPAEGYFATLAQVSTFAPKVLEQLKGLGGVPLRGRERHILFIDRLLLDSEATSVEVKEIPAAVFEPPTGLKKVPLKGFEVPEKRKIDRPKTFEKSFKEDDIDRENNPLKEGDKPKKDK